MPDQDQRAGADASAAAWKETYRHVLEVHYVLAGAGRVDEELHHWCLDKLNDVLGLIDEQERRDRAAIVRPGGDEAVS